MSKSALPSDISGRDFRRSRRPSERVRILGADVDLVRQEEVWGFVARSIAARTKVIIANHNLHSIYLKRSNAQLAAFYEKASLIEVDSAPMLLWSRLLMKRGRHFHRCTYLDWRDEFWRLVQSQGWRVFYLGGAPSTVTTAIAALHQEFGPIALEGAAGYFDAAPGSDENAAVVKRINKFKPNILLVGMGMPRQEIWINQNFEALPNSAIFNVGAAFDYEAGVQSPAPRWVGRIGLEWLFRLVSDPKRLFVRYCVQPWSLAPIALGDVAVALTPDKEPERRKSAHRRAPRLRNAEAPGRRDSDWRGLGTRPTN